MPPEPLSDRIPAELQAEIDRLGWYHTIEVAPGVATSGWWDLRHALPLMPWPDVRGKRCLDIGTWDGFYAFEMERRGAAEVVALDLADLSGLDYPPAVRADPEFDPTESSGQPRSAGFHYLHDLLESNVRWLGGSIYDLDSNDLGKFDVVVVGSLLVHLRDPVRALDAVRRVTSGDVLLIDYVHPSLDLLSRRRPLFELRGEGADFQWWLASSRGLEHLIRVGGFEVEEKSKGFLLRPGRQENASLAGVRKLPRHRAKRALNWAVTGDPTVGGHMHRAFRCRPLF